MTNATRILPLFLLLALGACSHMPSWLGGPKDDKPKLAGERLNALAISDNVRPDDAIKAVGVSLPAVNANSEWPQHTGMFTASGGNLAGGAFTKESDATAGEGNDFEHTLIARPVVGDGKVFVMDADGYISAHKAGEIDTIFWKSDGVHDEDAEQDNIGGGMAYDKGKLYATSGLGAVAGFDAASGKKFWSINVGAPFRSAPRVGGGKLYATTIDNQLYAIDIATGTVVWTHRGLSETGGWLNAVSPTIEGDTLLVPYSSGELYALTPDGTPTWSETISQHRRTEASDVFSGIGGDPVVDGEAVLAISSDNGLSALNVSTGDKYWERNVASINTPWVAGDYIFLLTTDNTVLCMMKFDGRIRWATKLASFKDEDRKLHPITWRGPVLSDGRVLVASSNGQLAVLSAADGSLRELEIADDIETAPVVAGGVLYLVGKNAKLYSYQ